MTNRPTRRIHPTKPARRRGTTLFELAVAFAVLATVTAVLLPAARRVDGLRRESDRRRRAAVELAGVLTDLAARPPADLPAGPVPVDLRPAFAASLPAPALTVTASPPETAAGVPVVRLAGTLAWTTDAGSPSRAVELSAWSVGTITAAGETPE